MSIFGHIRFRGGSPPGNLREVFYFCHIWRFNSRLPFGKQKYLPFSVSVYFLIGGGSRVFSGYEFVVTLILLSKPQNLQRSIFRNTGFRGRDVAERSYSA